VLLILLRAFLIGREASGQGNMLTIISGAFGVFRHPTWCVPWAAIGRARLAKISTWLRVCMTLAGEKGRDYRIHFVPDPMCWTEVPPT